jgi:hypothetical protein
MKQNFNYQRLFFIEDYKNKTIQSVHELLINRDFDRDQSRDL